MYKMKLLKLKRQAPGSKFHASKYKLNSSLFRCFEDLLSNGKQLNEKFFY